MSGGVGRRPGGRRPVLDLSRRSHRVGESPTHRRGAEGANLPGTSQAQRTTRDRHLWSTGPPPAVTEREASPPSALRSAVSTATTQITASDRTTDTTETTELPAFAGRHIGPREEDVAGMLSTVGRSSLADLIETAVPGGIRGAEALDIEPAASEVAVLEELREVAARNRVLTSMIGLGYYGTVTPAVIQRNVLENPSWYTAYTPYQPEISQGRLEALINFQTVVTDLTGLATANASMLDESTAVVEGMLVARRASKSASNVFIVDVDALPQTKALLEHRAGAVGIELRY